jgi:ATP synthase F1 gamma subunit
MLNEKDLILEISNLQNLSSVVETYKTIAASSMRRIRKSVLENREFMAGLADIFREVKAAYAKEITEARASGRVVREEVASVRKSKKTVFVLLSANTGLYGDIIARTFTYFAGEWEKSKPDAVIVGKIGKLLFENKYSHHPFRYFDFPDDRIDTESLKVITKEINLYERVVVFHGRFKNFFVQEAVSNYVSGEVPTEAKTGQEEAELPNYLFEPSYEAVATFFETEIFASSLEQLFYESRLSKLASRIALLDGATIQINRRLKQYILGKDNLRHRSINRKQINALSGVSLWG